MKERLLMLKLLSDETRLNILNVLFREDSYVEKIACELSLTPATICYHLKKMETAGLVNSKRSQFYIIYSLNKDIFNMPLYELIRDDTLSDTVNEKYRRETVSHFFKYGKLLRLPTQRKKREIVLAEIVKSFDIERAYSEEEVNEIIHEFHSDHCEIRREMISFGMLRRERESYWRVVNDE